MTLDDHEPKIEVLWIFGDFGMRDTYQERIAPKSVEADMEKYEIFSIERKFRRSKSRFSTGSRKPAREGTSVKGIFIVVGHAVFHENGCK